MCVCLCVRVCIPPKKPQNNSSRGELLLIPTVYVSLHPWEIIYKLFTKPNFFTKKYLSHIQSEKRFLWESLGGIKKRQHKSKESGLALTK